MGEGGTESRYMTVSTYNLKIQLLHSIHSSSYIINQTTNQHCQTVLMGKHSFARLYPKSDNENAPKTQTPTQSSCDLAENPPNSVEPKSIDDWQKTLLFLVYSSFSYSLQTFFFHFKSDYVLD